MFKKREEMSRRLHEIIERFRQKGATSPEKAMTIQELGLPPRFEEAMHRRLGLSGIFAEMNGKYYLNEERLEQIKEQRSKVWSESRGGDNVRARPPMWSRIVEIFLLLPIGAIIALVLIYFVAYRGGYFRGELLVIFVVIFLVLFAARLLFWSSRRRYWRRHLQEREQKAYLLFRDVANKL
jgi:hypothetical protein